MAILFAFALGRGSDRQTVEGTTSREDV